MSPTTKDTTANDPPLRPVANDADDASNTPPVTTEAKVHRALQDNPGATTSELAKMAGVGRSTAAKILARWAAEGVLIRRAGKDQRTPDMWTIPDAAIGADIDGMVGDIQTDSAARKIPAARDVAATNEYGAPTESDSSEITARSGNDTPIDGPKQTGAGPEPAGSISAQSMPNAALVPAMTSAHSDSTEIPDAVARNVTSGNVAPVPVDPGDEPVVETSSQEESGLPTTGTQNDRLPKGGLYELVKAYLAEHPGDSFGPAKIGTDLSRSSGAVSNALDKLVVDGHAVKTCEAPKRFTVKSGSVAVE